MNIHLRVVPKFELGVFSITDGANLELRATDVTNAIQRHLSGDWGELCESDKRANDQALAKGERLVSAYTSENGTRFWVITEWDRSATTVLLPHEY